MTRIIDVSLTVLAIAALLPLMLLIGIAVFLTDRGPILFAQRRIGRNGRYFLCLKFRSMAANAQERLDHLLAVDPAAKAEWEQSHKLKVDPRVTYVGRFLRKSSLDELPQLFNVLRGEMGLVGPRPIVDAERYRYGRYIEHYCSVRPGITGLWQVSGRSNTSYRRRVAFDVAYCRSRNTALDLKILAMTLPSVMFARGSY